MRGVILVALYGAVYHVETTLHFGSYRCDIPLHMRIECHKFTSTPFLSTYKAMSLSSHRNAQFLRINENVY